MITNRIFCTFLQLDNFDETFSSLKNNYTFFTNKIFVFEGEHNDEKKHFITYNLETPNITSIPSNTIFIHRKKESNTLYSLNGLNMAIKLENNNILDMKYLLNWNKYKNSLLLTQGDELKKINTKLIDIIKL